MWPLPYNTAVSLHFMSYLILITGNNFYKDFIYIFLKDQIWVAKLQMLYELPTYKYCTNDIFCFVLLIL